MQSLIASLNDHSIAMLRGIAQLRGVPPSTNIREEVAAQLAAALSEPEATEAALQSCSEGARAAWAALVAAGGRLTVPAFARRFGAIRPVGPGRLEREMHWQQPANPAEELWYHGLIFRAFADIGGGPAEYFYIPEDLLPLTAPDAAVPPLTAASQAPAKARQSHNRLAVDLCTLLGLLKDTPLRLDRSGAPRPADETHLREFLSDTDPTRFALLVTLARDLGWTADSQGRLAPRGDALRAWLHQRPWEQVSTLFSAWRESVAWNDLRHVPSIQAEGEWRNDPAAARKAILCTLSRLEPDKWYTVNHLVEWIKTVNPDFQRPDGVYSGWYLRDRATGHYLTGFESWDEVEGRYIAFLIHGPLFWLGAVALGSTGNGQADLFRLTPEGAAWIAGAPEPKQASGGKLVIDERFQIAAPLNLPLIDRFRLMRLAEPVPGPQPGEQATHLRMTRRRLAEARGSGVTGERILHFLRRVSGGRVPQPVIAGLTRWEQHGGMVRVSKGAVLRVEDAEILGALRADPVVAPLLGELLSAQAVMVSQANLGKLLSALATLGYTAKVDS